VASWESGNCDPLVLTELRATALAYRAIADATFEGVEEIHDYPAD
jgi:hypothetical protein